MPEQPQRRQTEDDRRRYRVEAHSNRGRDLLQRLKHPDGELPSRARTQAKGIPDHRGRRGSQQLVAGISLVRGSLSSGVRSPAIAVVAYSAS
jgi:hypothetical protein